MVKRGTKTTEDAPVRVTATKIVYIENNEVGEEKAVITTGGDSVRALAWFKQEFGEKPRDMWDVGTLNMHGAYLSAKRLGYPHTDVSFEDFMDHIVLPPDDDDEDDPILEALAEANRRLVDAGLEPVEPDTEVEGAGESTAASPPS